jgi:glycerophosphoryl diester phosphodiesterase
MFRPLLLGHRGARATRSIPENTIASFDLALTHGCDGFEFDVRQTADGRALICHDPKSGGTEIAEAAAGTLSDLPTLEQLLARYHATAFLDIEIKVACLETTLIRALHTHPPQRGFIVSSFLPGVLLTLQQLDPELPLGLICETRDQLALWHSLPLQVLVPHFTLTNIDLIRKTHSAGKRLFTWTVNRHEQMLQFLNWGVDGIISDDTEALGKLRSQELSRQP